jgi:hypothetical protein
MESIRKIRLLLQKNKLLNRLGADRAILSICVGIAFVLWILSKLSQSYITQKTVKLEYLLSTDRAFVEAPPAEVFIEVEATGWDLIYDFISSASVHLSYNLIGMNRFELSVARLRSDIKNQLNNEGIKIVDIGSEAINGYLEPRAYKKVPIVLKGKIKYAAGYFLRQKIVLSPDSVWISGPLSKIGKLNEWETSALILEEVKMDFSAEVLLRQPSSESRINRQKIKLSIIVEQFTQKKIFVPVSLVHAAPNVRVFPARIQLICSVGLSHFEQLSSDDFAAEADIAGQRPSKDNNTVAVQIIRQPLYIEHVRFSPHALEFFEIKK